MPAVYNTAVSNTTHITVSVSIKTVIFEDQQQAGEPYRFRVIDAGLDIRNYLNRVQSRYQNQQPEGSRIKGSRGVFRMFEQMSTLYVEMFVPEDQVEFKLTFSDYIKRKVNP